MKLERAFHLTTYLTVATTLSTLALAEGSAPLTVAILVLVGCAWLQEHAGRPRYLPAWLATALSLLSLPLGVLDAQLWSGSYVLGAAHLLAVIQLIKLFQPKADRDYLQIAFLSLLHLIVASVLTTALSFSIAFLIYFFTATWSLMLFHIRRASRGEGPAADGAAASPTSVAALRIDGRFAASVSCITLLTLLLTMSIFLFVPRVTMGFLHKQAGMPEAVVGFTEEVSLTEIGRIKLSRAQVMRVEPPGSRPLYGKQQLWRGKAFDRYTGAGWAATESRRAWVRGDDAGLVRLPAIAAVARQPAEEFRFHVREINTNVVFTAYYTTQIAGLSRALALDRYGTVYTGLMHYLGTSYVATARTSLGGAPPPAMLRANLATYLELPPGSERLGELARRVTAGAARPLEQALLLERYLRRAYAYSLDLKPALGRDPVNAFLFDWQAGHCELFASAMALMARAVGIPARYVTGFSGGEWNEFGGYYLVRQLDAHAWVEVHDPAVGWVPFDPTPAAPPDGAGGILARLGILQRYLDSLRVRWNAYVIDYSLHQQLKLTRLVRGLLSALSRHLVDAAASLTEAGRWAWRAAGSLARRNLPALLGISLALLGAAGLVWFAALGLARRRRAPSRPAAAIPLSYASFLKLMERHRRAKPAHLTPAEFAAALLEDRRLPASAIDLLTLGYYAARFGHTPTTPGQESAEAAALAALRAALRGPDTASRGAAASVCFSN
ncbi:MAG: DUF3488 domain-containing protein [Candidatus Tectomicrobia bacterium]|nr:DUF3488 domain-containing protein [Candidatus Tectomicrobia bacterium]